MKLYSMEKLSRRIDAIKKKSKIKYDESGNVIQHDYRKLKILMRGKYKPEIGAMPVAIKETNK